MKYDLILFDADDTLFDHKASQRIAFFQTLSHYIPEADLEGCYSTFRNENTLLWKDFEAGKVTTDFLKVERFHRMNSKHNLSLHPNEVSEQYLKQLSQSTLLIEQAYEVCFLLSRKVTLGIVTNGIESVQVHRLKMSSLFPLINFIVVSESCGFPKPDIRFFDYTSKFYPNFCKERTLLVGDRLETDIEGARRFGIDSCWFNPNREKNTLGAPKYEIARLTELLEVLQF